VTHTDRTTVDLETTWDRPTSDDDIFGVARYLADAVNQGEITEADGERALLDWAGPDRDALRRAATYLSPKSEAEHLLRAAYDHAA